MHVQKRTTAAVNRLGATVRQEEQQSRDIQRRHHVRVSLPSRWAKGHDDDAFILAPEIARQRPVACLRPDQLGLT
jgi:hypothetical protein